MTVEYFFDQFITDNLNLKKICDGECDGSKVGCDICFIKKRYEKLVESLENELKLLPTEDEEKKPSHFLTGSYRRHTMIRPPKDVDLFIVLDSGEYQDDELKDLITPKALIDKLKNTLDEIFDGKDLVIKKQRHSVCVTYNKKFSIDVIPAFETDDKKAYKIPNIEHTDNGSYIISNPKLHYEYINEINDKTAVNDKKRFKKIVRLLKFIKRRNFAKKPIKIRSFHFEMLAAKILKSKKINSYAEGLTDFLLNAQNYFDIPSITDPANQDNKVDDYIDEFSDDEKNIIKTKLEELYQISVKALEFEENNEEEKAINEWKKIFFIKKKSNKSDHQNYSYTGNLTSKPWLNILKKPIYLI